MINRLQTASQPVTERLSTADFVHAFGSHKISLVRASGETFRRRVIDALRGARDPCLLGVLFCRRPVLPGPAPPPRCAPRCAPRPDPPVVCPGFGIDRFCCTMCFMYSYVLYFFVLHARYTVYISFFTPCILYIHMF